MMIKTSNYDRLPFLLIQVTNQWDLGGDGKVFWGHSPDEEWYIKLMRK